MSAGYENKKTVLEEQRQTS